MTDAPSGYDSIGEYLADVLPDDASLTVVAIRDRKAVYRRGFGMADREAGAHCDYRTAYDNGSITKRFTAAAILRPDGLLRRQRRRLGPG